MPPPPADSPPGVDDWISQRILSYLRVPRHPSVVAHKEPVAEVTMRVAMREAMRAAMRVARAGVWIG